MAGLPAKTGAPCRDRALFAIIELNRSGRMARFVFEEGFL